jgi:hypothetical protein
MQRQFEGGDAVRQTPELADLVEVLFGTQLGGGTDID